MRDKKKFCFVLELRRRRRGTNNAKKTCLGFQMGFADNRNRGLPHVLNCSFEGTYYSLLYKRLLPEGGIIPLDHKAIAIFSMDFAQKAQYFAFFLTLKEIKVYKYTH